MFDTTAKSINVFFVREHRHYFNKANKKKKSDYIINVDKVMADKIKDNQMYIMNKVQAFLINYEIKKMLDKAVTISNHKYDTIVYINANIGKSTILNTQKFLTESYYGKLNFKFAAIDKTGDLGNCENVEIKKDR
jgi:hypothetical protein